MLHFTGSSSTPALLIGFTCCKPGSRGDVSNTQQNFPVWADTVSLWNCPCQGQSWHLPAAAICAWLQVRCDSELLSGVRTYLQKLLTVTHPSFHKGTLPYGGIVAAMLVGTKRKDLQNHNTSCSFAPTTAPPPLSLFCCSGQILLSIDCYRSQHKVALRFQERDFSALQPCS